MRGLLRQALEHLAVAQPVIDEIGLALTEACANDPDAVQVEGQPTDAERGRGLVLMRALVDRLQFVQDADGRHRVTFEKRLAAQQPHLRLLSN